MRGVKGNELKRDTTSISYSINNIAEEKPVSMLNGFSMLFDITLLECPNC
jgi:hypothetical protein